MKQAKRIKLINYIANKSYRGASLTDALKYYVEEIEDAPADKAEIKKVIEEIKRGGKTEDVLRKNNIIDTFQYAILKASSRQREAYALLPTITANKKNSIGKFYLSVTAFKVLLITSIFYGAPEVEAMIAPLVATKAEVGGEAIEIPFVFTDNPIMHLIANGMLIGYISLIIFYFWSYRKNIALHYKIFKFRAYTDSIIYLSLLKNMINNGIISYKAFEILGNYIEPFSARQYFKSIAQKIKNGGKEHFFKKELDALGIDEYTQYEFKVAYNSGDYGEAIENAYESAVGFIKEEEPKHKAMITDVLDIAIYSVGMYFLYSFMILTSKIV